MDLHDCPCSGKTLARLVQPAVMAILAREPLHGYLVVQRLAAMPMFCGQSPDPTGVYRLLKAMEREGLVESTLQSADNRPAKRSFALTASGRACLDRWAETLQDYHDSIAGLLSTVTQATRPRPPAAKRPARRTT